MIFIKLIRVLAVAFGVWLILHLLYCLGRKKAAARPDGKDRSGNAHRKFVKSSVVEKQNHTDDDRQS